MAPSRCGYPDATNTGPAAGLQLDPSGSVNASVRGQVIDGQSITGEVNVTASDVTLKNSRVLGGRGAGNPDWVIVVRPGVRTFTVQDTELSTPRGSAQDIACILNIGDARITVIRANIHGCSAGVSTGGGIVRDSYIHDMARIPGASHDVGIASNGGGGLTVEHNTVLNQFSQTAAIALYQDFGVQRDDLIRDNLVGGGSYCIYGGAGTKGTTSGIRIIGNRFSRQFHPGCGNFGPLASFDAGGHGNEFAANFWDDTGEDVA